MPERKKRAAVLAAGCVVWRERKDELQVLLIHRPRYDDWSLPKGKTERAESLPAAAVREVEEETGHRVRLQSPLTPIEYLLSDGRLKRVEYWIGRSLSRTGPGPQNPREVDEVRWVSVSRARKMLTREADAEVVSEFAARAAKGRHETTALVIQRHAAAKSRAKWGKGEATRPLSSKGKKQAKALPDILGAFAPERVVSSPWKRCRDTIAPFAKQAGMRVLTKDELTEFGHKAHAARTRAIIGRLLDEQIATVVCTHRPVLPSVMSAIGKASTESVRSLLPDEDPYLAAGEMLVLHVDRSGTPVALERHLPQVD